MVVQDGEYKANYNNFTIGFRLNYTRQFKGINIGFRLARKEKVDIYYTVSFNTNSESPITSQTVKRYSTATRPAETPTKEGFTFGDWFLPSKDELNLIYYNLKNIGFSEFSIGNYW